MDAEDELYNMMKDLPDFNCLPIPSHWYKKYNLPPRDPITPKEFIESNYTMMRAVEQKDLPPLIIDEPQQDGKLFEFVKEEEVKVDVVSRPLDWDPEKPFPAVLPALKEIEEKGEISTAVESSTG